MEVLEAEPAAGMVAEEGFTEADLAAADQLVQLSVSGGGEDDASSSSTTLSVSNAMAVAREQAYAAADADDDDDEMGLDRRVRKRYRLLAELYAATRPAADGGGGGGKRKKREEVGMQQR